MTIEERLQNLEQELSRAKRRNRWLLVGFGCAVAGISMLWTGRGIETTAQAQGQALRVIRAHAFILEDEKGRERASLLANSGGASLRLHDDTNQGAVLLGVSSEGTALHLRDKNNRVRAALEGANDEDEPSLALLAEDGKVRAKLRISSQDTSFNLNDAQGVRVLLDSSQNSSGLRLFDEKAHPRFALRLDKNGPGLALNDAKEVRVMMRLWEDGPSLNLYDEKGQGRATLGKTRVTSSDGRVMIHPESSLLLFGPDNKVIWEAPR